MSFDDLLENARTKLDDDVLVAKLGVHLRRATAIESGSAEPERDEPFYDASFGAVPELPKGPMFPELDAALARRPSRAFARLRDSLDETQRRLVAHADAQEYIDALGNARRYRYAAGHVAAAAAALTAWIASR